MKNFNLDFYSMVFLTGSLKLHSSGDSLSITFIPYNDLYIFPEFTSICFSPFFPPVVQVLKFIYHCIMHFKGSLKSYFFFLLEYGKMCFGFMRNLACVHLFVHAVFRFGLKAGLWENLGT